MQARANGITLELEIEVRSDAPAGPDALPVNPGEVFADSAYRGSRRDAVRAKGGLPDEAGADAEAGHRENGQAQVLPQSRIWPQIRQPVLPARRSPYIAGVCL